MSQLTKAYFQLLKTDFVTFAMRCLKEIDPTTEYQHNWHIDLIAEALMQCMSGDCTRLIINMPPRYLKSILASVIFPAWVLGHNPSAKIMCISYGQDLAEKHARDFRNIVSSHWYQALFPNTRLEKNSIQEMTTTKNGFRYSASVGGSITGRGADYIIIDDPLKPDEAISDVLRKSVNAWFMSNAFTRLDNKANGRIILVMQRLHEDDLAGCLISQGGWKVLAFPAIAQEDEVHDISTTMGSCRIIRRTGEALHCKREPLEILEQIRTTMGEYNFMGQYQQNPMPAEGNMVKTHWFKRYDPANLPHFVRIIQSWDTASKAENIHDFSACTTWGVTEDNHYYLLNVLRRRFEFPELKRLVRDWQKSYRADVVVIEDAGSGIQLIQQLQSEGMGCIQPHKTKSIEKKVRLYTQTPAIEGGLVYLPNEATWLPDYIKELTSFPNGKHDDQVDSTSQFLEYVKMPVIGQTAIDCMKILIERQKK